MSPWKALACLLALHHRWQKGKDILWYTRQKGDDEAQQRQDELAAIKAREEELMAEVRPQLPLCTQLTPLTKLYNACGRPRCKQCKDGLVAVEERKGQLMVARALRSCIAQCALLDEMCGCCRVLVTFRCSQQHADDGLLASLHHVLNLD